jgi:hypothetical protein
VKQFLSRTSPFVISEIKSLIKPFFTGLPQGKYNLYVLPKSYDIEDYFWKLHKSSPQEFVKAISQTLPPNYNLISYEHFINIISIEVV